MPVDLTQLAGNNPDPELNEQAMQEIPVDEDLAEYVFLLGVDLLEEGGGMNTLRKAVEQSSDPVAVIGQFIVQMVGQLSEVLNEEVNFDPRVMLVQDGFVDSITDYIVEKLNMGDDAAEMIEQEVLEMIKGLAQGETKPDPNAEMPPEAAPMEQQAGMPPAQGAPLDGGMGPQQGGGLDQMGGMV